MIGRSSIAVLAAALSAATAAGLAVAAAAAEEAAAGPWKRRVIDDSSRGADGVRIADVDGDGLPDIATGWEEGGVVRIYLHPGRDRAAERWPAVTAGAVASPEDAVLADLDGDGAIDAVSSCEGRTRSIFFHWAPPEPARRLDPAAWKTGAVPAARGKEQWMFALPLQVDGRGGIDLVVGSKGENASVSWLQSPEDARDLASWKLHRLRDAGWVMSLEAHDLDGDGDLDVLLSDRKGPARGVSWLENPGAEEAARGGRWRENIIDRGLGEVMFLAAADLDGDGRRDVICAVSGGPIAFLRATGDAAAPWRRHDIPVPAGCGTGKAVAAGDLDGDSRLDLVLSCENARAPRSGVCWLSWKGSPVDGEWTGRDISGPAGTKSLSQNPIRRPEASQPAEARRGFGIGSKFDRIELVDLDLDGDLDVLTCEEAEGLGIVWYENPR